MTTQAQAAILKGLFLVMLVGHVVTISMENCIAFTESVDAQDFFDKGFVARCPFDILYGPEADVIEQGMCHDCLSYYVTHVAPFFRG